MAENRITLGMLLFPPYVMLDEVTSECVGNGINITKKIIAEYAQSIDVICAPPSRIYQLMHQGKIDFTINIRKTDSLPADTTFIDTPFRKIVLNMYSHKDKMLKQDIAAITGFTYQGKRDTLIEQGYEFVDMPTSISAIQVFLKNQSSHLLSYSSSMDYYIEEKDLNIKDRVLTQVIFEVTTHYAISAKSRYNQRLQNIFNDYADKHQVSYFNLIEY